MTLIASAVGPQGYARRYKVEASAVGQLRRDVELVLATWHLQDLTDNAKQVISEMASNVVDHAATGCSLKDMEVALTRLEGGVRIAVGDQCSRPPVQKEASPTDENGRGLFLISILASRWGWTYRPRGKHVWADLLI